MAIVITIKIIIITIIRVKSLIMIELGNSQFVSVIINYPVKVSNARLLITTLTYYYAVDKSLRVCDFCTICVRICLGLL